MILTHLNFIRGNLVECGAKNRAYYGFERRYNVFDRGTLFDCVASLIYNDLAAVIATCLSQQVTIQISHYLYRKQSATLWQYYYLKVPINTEIENPAHC